MNSTLTIPDESVFVTELFIYVVQGSVNFITNLLLVLPIVCHEALRTQNKYILVAGVAVADGLNGLAFATAGIALPRLEN